MKINKEKNGIIIGAIFTLVNLLLTFAFVVPILTVYIGADVIESILKTLLANNPYNHIGKAAIITLSILLVSTLFFFLVLIRRKSKTQKISNLLIVGIMGIEYFIIHTLGFYIYWGICLNFRSDGQLIFGAVASFPVSSFGFLAIGILVDLVKHKKESYLVKYK